MEKYRRELVALLFFTVFLLFVGLFVHVRENRVLEVVFQLDSETVYEVQKVSYRDRVTKPKDPEREGQIFLGWYRNDKKYDFSTPVTKNMKLVARFTDRTENWVRVTFKIGDLEKSVLVTKGEKVPCPELPSKLGYRFLGWYLENGEAFDLTTPITDEMTLIARFEKIGSSHRETPKDTPSGSPSPTVSPTSKTYTYTVEWIDRDRTSIERLIRIYQGKKEVTKEVQELRSGDIILGKYSSKLGGIRVVYAQFLKYEQYQAVFTDGKLVLLMRKEEK